MHDRTLGQYWKEHLTLYVFVGVIFITGVVFGAVMVNALSLEQKQEMTRHLSHFFTSVNSGALEGGEQLTFKQSFTMHLKWIVIIWFLGLSVIGLPLILILDFIKGVLIGFTVGYLAGQLSWKGLLFAFVSVVPQNLIIIPVLLICSVTAVSFSIYMVKSRLFGRGGPLMEPFIRFTATAALCLLCMGGVSLFEAYVSPVMLQWVAPFFSELS